MDLVKIIFKFEISCLYQQLHFRHVSLMFDQEFQIRFANCALKQIHALQLVHLLIYSSCELIQISASFKSTCYFFYVSVNLGSNSCMVPLIFLHLLHPFTALFQTTFVLYLQLAYLLPYSLFRVFKQIILPLLGGYDVFNVLTTVCSHYDLSHCVAYILYFSFTFQFPFDLPKVVKQ